MSELILKKDALNCFHDWIDRYGHEHTVDEDTVYQRIEALDAVRRCDEDCISRRVAIDAIDDIESEVADGFGFQYEKWREYFCELPAVQPYHNADVSKKVADEDCISRQMAIDEVSRWVGYLDEDMITRIQIGLRRLPSAQPEWNNHTVARLLTELFDDTCACNYNGIDEWLPEKCELLESCPNPVGVACWEQFLKHRTERVTDE